MTNPILDMLQKRTTNQTSNVTNSPIQELLRSRNPQELVTNMLNKNPNAGLIMDTIRQNGGNPKQAFYAMARQKGIDPDNFIAKLH